MRTRAIEAAVAALRRYLAGGRLILPEGTAPLWRIFLDLHGARQSGPTMPEPISFAEIDAYARLYRWPLQPHHVDLIRALDRAWLDFATKPGGSTQPAGPAQNLTPAAFDAVFG